MKRKVTLFLSILLVFSLLISCSKQGGTDQKDNTNTGDTTTSSESGSGTTDSSDSSKDSSSKAKITLNYWHSMGAGPNGEAIEYEVQEFNKKYEGQIEIIATYQGNYDETTPKIMQALAAGTQPDIVMMDAPRLPQFIDAGVCEELSSYIAKDNIDLNDFVEALFGYGKDGDKIYAMPLNRSTPILYYNKDAFKEVGLDPEKPPETWDELFEYAQKLTKTENGQVVRHGIGFGFDFHWWMSAMVLQQGSRILDENGKMVCLDDGTLLNALKFWDKLNKSGVYRKPTTSNDGTVRLNAFYQGEIAMIWQSTGSLGQILQNTKGKFEVGTGFLPKVTQYGVATGGACLFIPAQCTQEQKDAAWEALKFFTSTEMATEFTVRTGYLPIRKSVIETDIIKELWEKYPQYKTAYEQLQYARDTFRTPYLTEFHLEGNKILEALILEESITPEQALEKIRELANRLLE